MTDEKNTAPEAEKEEAAPEIEVVAENCEADKEGMG